jgi:hypothetical protein
MSRVFRYYNHVEGMRGSVLGLPAWARFVLLILVSPAIVAMALSIAAFLVSLLALLVIAVPAYRLLKAITGGLVARTPSGSPDAQEIVDDLGSGGFGRGDARRIDVTVRDATIDEKAKYSG